MPNPLDKMVLAGTIAPYLPASFVGGQGPSPLASLRGTKVWVQPRLPSTTASNSAESTASARVFQVAVETTPSASISEQAR